MSDDIFSHYAILRCMRCHTPMADIYLRNGRTYLQVGFSYAIRAEIICPECGARRRFRSVFILQNQENSI